MGREVARLLMYRRDGRVRRANRVSSAGISQSTNAVFRLWSCSQRSRTVREVGLGGHARGSSRSRSPPPRSREFGPERVEKQRLRPAPAGDRLSLWTDRSTPCRNRAPNLPGACTQQSHRGTPVAATNHLSRPHSPPDDVVDRAQSDRRLFRRYVDAHDPVDRDAIVERFLPLARQLAARYQRPEEPFDDVFQVACFGLVKAVDRFDVERGVAFSSYAVPTIMGEIKRHFRDRTWAVRVPRDLQELALRVDRVIGELTRELGRQPLVDEVAHAIDAEPEDVLEAMQASSAYRATSLQTPRAGGDDEPGDTLGDSVGAIDDGYDRAEQRAVLQALMNSLTPREREVVRLRFEEDLTQAAIGERIGVSQMQVSRVLRQAVARLRTLARVENGASPG